MTAADYFLTGIWKDGNDITDVMLHSSDNNILQEGKKTSLIKLVEILSNGRMVIALKWDYQMGRWINIAPIEFHKKPNGFTLCCRHYQLGISLTNLLNMDAIYHTIAPIVPLVRHRNKEQ